MKTISRRELKALMPLGSRWFARFPDGKIAERTVRAHKSWGIQFHQSELRFEVGDTIRKSVTIIAVRSADGYEIQYQQDRLPAPASAPRPQNASHTSS